MYMQYIFCVPIHLLMGIWVVSAFWLLSTSLLWTLVYKYLFEYLLSFFFFFFSDFSFLLNMLQKRFSQKAHVVIGLLMFFFLCLPLSS